MKEYSIGSRIEIDKIIYEVRPADLCCQGCSLFFEEEYECLDKNFRFGACSGHLREDRKNVIFVQVGEAKDKS